ncbi:MAG: hypothetical protein Q9211_001777 [Gyalolechia sp. 1 TL-2023]
MASTSESLNQPLPGIYAGREDSSIAGATKPGVFLFHLRLHIYTFPFLEEIWLCQQATEQPRCITTSFIKTTNRPKEDFQHHLHDDSRCQDRFRGLAGALAPKLKRQKVLMPTPINCLRSIGPSISSSGMTSYQRSDAE